MQTLSADDLTRRVRLLLQAAGSDEKVAQQVAANLVLANLSGHDSHGVGMAPRYVDAILEGRLNPKADAAVRVDAGALMGLDGQGGFGQWVGVQAMELAFARVRQFGCCVFTLAHAHHLGRIGHFAEMAAEHGWVSLHFVNVDARPVVAPAGGSDGRFGTNPICMGIPVGTPGSPDPSRAFILDFATSRVAQGKMRVAHNEGRRVPEGYLIDAHGQPTTDPGVVVVPQADGRMGALKTFGEYKGFGLAVVAELLGGALSGGGTWHREADGRRAVFNSMFCVVVDPVKLGTQDAFFAETRAFLDWLKQSPAAPGQPLGVQLPGEPERAARQERMAQGLRIDPATWQELVESAKKVNVAFA